LIELEILIGKKKKVKLNRWKGQNVATTEVSKVLGNFKGINEANVYGVYVPGIIQITFLRT
jgi:hypothetical protein